MVDCRNCKFWSGTFTGSRNHQHWVEKCYHKNNLRKDGDDYILILTPRTKNLFGKCGDFKKK